MKQEKTTEMDKPNYFAIIPADVRYDNRLDAETKLLYGEITCLCNSQGFCFATNSYFARLYGKDERTIRRHISKLVECGYIHLQIEMNTRRKIYINSSSIPRTKMSEGEDKNVLGTPDKNVPHNKINNNNKNNIYATSKKKRISNYEQREYTAEEFEKLYDNL